MPSAIDMRNLYLLLIFVSICMMVYAIRGLFCVGCAHVSRDEVARSLSPDGRLEAFLIETNGGATTSFGYEIRLGQKGDRRGTRVAWLYGATRNEEAYGVNLRWTSEKELSIEYFQAKEAVLEMGRLQVSGREVQINLHEGVRDPSASPGGMLYNLQGRPAAAVSRLPHLSRGRRGHSPDFGPHSGPVGA